MANQQIFCNTPWYEVNIYWDGSLGICCQESRKLSTDPQYNIKNMTLSQWFNSEPVREFRQAVLSDTPTDVCNRCYYEEEVSNTSRRHRANQKSVIFTKTAFQNSFNQSPSLKHFSSDGITDTMPIDLHLDLGNYCNLACKMCHSSASSRIATQHVKWGDKEHQQYLGNDWTKDPVVWSRFLHELLTIPKLKNIHFMGGETLITARFEEFVDFMIHHKRFELCFSFVSNGTSFNPSLMDKLKKFSRVGIEISIETVTPHNDYIRQGSDTKKILSNIKKYKEYCTNSSISITLRPAISALSVGYYHTLLEYCLENQFLVKSLLVTNPPYLDISVLPSKIKENYKIQYNKILDKLSAVDVSTDYNESNQLNYLKSIKVQAEQVINLLNQPSNDHLLKDMVNHCRRWDTVYKFNAVDLYPELAELFKEYDY